MRELPILFSGPMVKAILENRKTMTRRVMKPQPPAGYDAPILLTETEYGFRKPSQGHRPFFATPSYQVGDRLWVKETYAERRDVDWRIAPDKARHYAHYKAEDNWVPKDPMNWHEYLGWKSGRFMPKCLARLWLEVTAVRAERLQSITEEDAIAEGVGAGFQMNGGWPDYQHIRNGVCELTQDTAVMSFATLWDSINGKTHPWESNPWCWCYTFKRIEQP